MSKELIERLRVFAGDPVLGSVADEAADALEAQQHELRVKDLTIGKMANDMAAAQKRIEEKINLLKGTEFFLDCANAEAKRLHAALAAAQAREKVLRDALENCRLFAARRRAEEWATHILRLCESGGSVANPLRQDDSALRELWRA